MNYILIFSTLLLCFLLSEAAHSTPQQSVLKGLAETKNGKITQDNVDKYAKDHNLQYLAPASLLTGKIKIRKDGNAIVVERDKVTVMKTWRLE